MAERVVGEGNLLGEGEERVSADWKARATNEASAPLSCKGETGRNQPRVRTSTRRR